VNKAPNKPLPPLEREFIKLVLSKQGQQVVIKDGYIPLPAKAALESRQMAKGRPAGACLLAFFHGPVMERSSVCHMPGAYSVRHQAAQGRETAPRPGKVACCPNFVRYPFEINSLPRWSRTPVGCNISVTKSV